MLNLEKCGLDNHNFPRKMSLFPIYSQCLYQFMKKNHFTMLNLEKCGLDNHNFPRKMLFPIYSQCPYRFMKCNSFVRKEWFLWLFLESPRRCLWGIINTCVKICHLMVTEVIQLPLRDQEINKSPSISSIYFWIIIINKSVSNITIYSCGTTYF